MDIGEAVKHAKNGHKVARAGWNGKGMYIYYVPANSYAPTTMAARQEFGGGPVPYRSYMAMKTAQGDVVPWLCSQSDLLDEDWEIVS
jgi:hypothetical protein